MYLYCGLVYNTGMCGRFALEDDGTAVAQQFELATAEPMAPRYNIAPTQPVAAVALQKNGERGLTHFQWGLIPSWARDIKMGARMINARSETAAEKPAFRAAFKRRRCLIPMTGFYEWQKQNGGAKQPMYIHPQDEALFAAAGLWEQWQSDDGSEILSCTILTTTANKLMETIHDRMPVFVSREDYDLWLDEEAPLPAVQAILKPYPAERMATYPVSAYVNNPRNEGEACVEPLK